MIDETQSAGGKGAPPVTNKPPKPKDRAVKSGEVKVRVVTHALLEAGTRYVKGEEFVTSADRAAGLKGFVEEVK